MELQRNPPPNTDPNLRIFTIRGAPQQMEVARHLIDEKVGVRTRASPHLAYTSWICFWMSKVPAFPQNLVLPVPLHPCIVWGQPLLLSKGKSKAQGVPGPRCNERSPWHDCQGFSSQTSGHVPAGVNELQESSLPPALPQVPSGLTLATSPTGSFH